MSEPSQDQQHSSTERMRAQAQADKPCRAREHSPVPVTRGETVSVSQEDTPQLALIDWLAFTVYPGHKDWRWVCECLHHIFGLPENCWNRDSRPWHGYTHRLDLIYPSDGGERPIIGLIAWGGDSQRGTIHVSFNGQGCARLVDWEQIQTWGEYTGSVITRVDVAHDDFEGQTVNINQTRAWFDSGGFSANGRPPEAKLIDDLGSGKGKTFYVGKRQFGKLCRIYEKGKKEGEPDSSWCRVEVEFRNKNREIPWDIVTRPGDYLAGAYPCLAYLSQHQERIKTIRRTAQIQYAHMVEWVRTSAGKALNVIHQVEDGNAGAVLEQVLRDGKPKRLQPFIGYDELLRELAHADTKP